MLNDNNRYIEYSLEDFFGLLRICKNLRKDLQDRINTTLNNICQCLQVDLISGKVLFPDDEDYRDGKLIWLPMSLEFSKPDVVIFDEFDLSEGFPVDWLDLNFEEVSNEINNLNNESKQIAEAYSEYDKKIMDLKQDYNTILENIEKELINRLEGIKNVYRL